MKKNYKFPHLVMLQTCQVIVTLLIAEIILFTERRKSITVEFAQALLKRIVDGIKLVSTDKLINQKNATLLVGSIVEDARKRAKTLYTDLCTVYAKDKVRLNFILQTLGFTQWYARASKGNQGALEGLLFAFSQNIEPLRAELIGKDINAATLDDLCNDAAQFNDANTKQEGEKSLISDLNETQQTELNDIYTEVMAICKLGKDIFSDDPGKQKMFIFSDIAKGFQGRGGNKPDEGEKPIS